jgi:DNA-directed RNA polymerase specialized sigma24 family protein
MKVGRPINKWTPEMEQTLMDMKADGVHFRDIAVHLGVSVTAVEQRFQKIRRSKL